MEFAGDEAAPNVEDIARQILAIEPSSALETLAYHDSKSGSGRVACFSGAQFLGALYISREPVAVSRMWACDQLAQDHADPKARAQILAGRAGADMPDKGAIVCSCFSVGSGEISQAVRAGCISVDAIGKALGAGTNCGSCRAEIQQIINENCLIAAE
jgi:assimilatory nitrate reductase catalytic subunit